MRVRAIGTVAILALAFGFVLGSGFGKDEMDGGMPPPQKPGAEHKALQAWVGTWKTTVTMGANKTPGSAEFSWALDGHFLKQDFKSGPFQGLGLMGYDPQTEEYFDVWFDNQGLGYMAARGPVPEKGEPIVLRGEGAMGAYREVIQMTGDAKARYQNFVENEEGEEKLLVEVDYSK
jgi:hypothetical protein